MPSHEPHESAGSAASGATGTSDFTSFFRAQFPATVHSIERIAGLAAEDIAQEAFIVALQRWGSIASMDAPDAWVRLVARRMAWRRCGRETERTIREAATRGPAGADDVMVDAIDLDRALTGLPDRDQLAVRLHYLADLPITQVAEVLGCKQAAAKTRLHRARERLAESLIGYRGRWSSEHRWRPDGIATRMHETHDDAFTDVILDDVRSRDTRWTLTIDRGAYRVDTDDGEPLDRGRYRRRDGMIVMTPWNESGEIVLVPSVDGARATFTVLSDDTAPTRGVPDDAWLRLFLEADTFAWSEAPTPDRM